MTQRQLFTQDQELRKCFKGNLVPQ
uniref:Uncharacterized protein n=1 Tax=Leersia perrieri TaxID=77586 RepID=A0A0D9VZK0_9ORYZ